MKQIVQDNRYLYSAQLVSFDYIRASFDDIQWKAAKESTPIPPVPKTLFGAHLRTVEADEYFCL